MIKTEIIQIGTKTFTKVYSDSGKYIIQNETGKKYTEAVDVEDKYTYSESEEIIEIEPNEDNIDN